MANSEDDFIPGVYPDLEDYAFAGVKQKFEGIVTPNNTNVSKNNINVVYKVYDNNNTLVDTFNSNTDTNGKHILQYTFPKKGDYTIIASVGDDTFSLPVSVESLVDNVSISSSSSSVTAGGTVTLNANVTSSITHTVEGADVIFEITEGIDSFTEEKSINDFSELDYDIHLPKINLECKLKGQLAVSIIPSGSSTESQILQISSNSYKTFKIVDDGKYYLDNVLQGTLSAGIKKLYIWGNGYVKELTFAGNDAVIAPSTGTSGATNVNYIFPGGTCHVKAIVSYGIDSNESSSITITEFDEITVTSDKDIISYNGGNNPESATLSAQLKKNGANANVSGQTVTFEVRKVSDDSLVETLTGNTDSRGIATVSYTSKHAGDLYIKSLCGLVSETYVLIDAFKYIASGSHTFGSSTEFINLADVNDLMDYEISIKLKSTQVKASCIAIKQSNDNANRYLLRTGFNRDPNPYVVVLTTQVTERYTDSNHPSSANTFYDMKIKRENGVYTCTTDGYSHSVSSPPSDLRYFGLESWEFSKTVEYRDFIVKPL